VVTPFYFVLGAATWPLIHGPYRYSIEGRENLPTDSGFVLCANHNSNFDPWPLGLALWPKQQLRFMAKSELFNPLLKGAMNATGAFPVRRGEGDMDAMKTAMRLAKSGEIIAMFPEGTRPGKGLRKKFDARPHTGAARIALGAKVPLVPAALKGTDGLSRFAQLKVSYGKPVEIDDLADLSHREAAQIATDRLMEAIWKLHAEL
jgi:1-acyl-sn-glycerol-3-phosphate acyltransferase